MNVTHLMAFRPRKAQPPRPPAPALGTDALVAREETCRGCQWNHDWTCQNIGCKVCPGAQARVGPSPLLKFLAQPGFKCPINKF